MDPFTLAELGLSLLEQYLGVLTKSKAPQEQIDRVAAAIAEIRQVHGSAVTKTQIEGLLVPQPWLSAT